MSTTRFRFLLILAIAHLLLCFQVLAQTPFPSSTLPTPKLSLTHRVKYLVTIDESRPHSLSVEMTISNPGSQLNVGIPAWCPGFYQILQYQKAIERLTASDETGSPLTIKHDKIRNWQISGLRKEAKEVVFRYQVKAIDRGLGFFGSMLDLKRRIAYINGASAFMFVNGDSQSPVSLELSLPNGWKVATPLEVSEEESLVDSKNGAHIKLIAKNYEELIDCPLQLGSFQSFDFSALNATIEETNSARPQFQCVLVGNQKADIPKVRTALSKICRAAIDVFKMTPFHKYVFFYHIGESGFEGGLEHRSSTVIHLADPLLEGDDDEFLTTTSHEFFHAWNVKYLRPIGLGPFDLTKQVRTTSLWWAEGVTDYYADLLLFRAGIRDRAWFLKQIQEHIAALDNNPARNRVSLEEASRKSWEGESEGFGGLSYYLKGGLAGFYFDLSLREQSKGAKNLDDVMREMVDAYGKKDEAYPENAIISILNRLLEKDFSDSYNQIVKGTSDIDWSPIMKNMGLKLTRTEESFLGVSLQPQTNTEARDDLQADDIFPVIERVEDGSPAEKMGLKAGDAIELLNGKPVNYSIAGVTIRTLPPLKEFAITLRREGRELKLKGVSGVRYASHLLKLAGSIKGQVESEEFRKKLLGLFILE